jgi:hypothetical protein
MEKGREIESPKNPRSISARCLWSWGSGVAANFGIGYTLYLNVFTHTTLTSSSSHTLPTQPERPNTRPTHSEGLYTFTSTYPAPGHVDVLTPTHPAPGVSSRGGWSRTPAPAAHTYALYLAAHTYTLYSAAHTNTAHTYTLYPLPCCSHLYLTQV